MDELPDVYYIENLEQLRAIADALRVRIIEVLLASPRTATQIAEQCGMPANKVHYHVRELERVGLVRIVETRERGAFWRSTMDPSAGVSRSRKGCSARHPRMIASPWWRRCCAT